MTHPGQCSFLRPDVGFEPCGGGSGGGGPVFDGLQAPVAGGGKIRKVNGFRDLEGKGEPGQDEAVGVGQGGGVDVRAAADDQFGDAIGASEVEGGRDRSGDAMAGGKRAERRVAGEDDGGAIAEPALHLQIGAPPHEQPTPGRTRPEVCPVAGMIPGNAARGFPDDPVSGERGDERDEHDAAG